MTAVRAVRIYSTIPNAANTREGTPGYTERGISAAFSSGAAEGVGRFSSSQRVWNGGYFGVRKLAAVSSLRFFFPLKHGQKSIKVNTRQI